MPECPTDLKIDSAGTTAIRINWSSPFGRCDGIKIEYGEMDGEKICKDCKPCETEFQMTTCTPGTIYSFTVYSYVGDFESEKASVTGKTGKWLPL